MLYILCQEQTARLTFIFKLIFTGLLGVKYKIITSVDQVVSGAPILNYSAFSVKNAYTVKPSALLFESGISEDIKLDIEEGNRLKLRTEDYFDPFASAFYLVSRYEEYQDYKPDAHNRFPSDQSVLHTTGLLNLPVVNLWALTLEDDLKSTFELFESTPRKFEHIPTIDIDQAWKYRYKGLRRNIGGLLGDIIRFDFLKIKERVQVLTGKIKDPFDNFDYQLEVHKKHGIKPRYFIQVGKRSKHDKNLPASCNQFAALIRELDQCGTVGMHPSYTSNTNRDELRSEYMQLSNVLNTEVISSRQHFLMHKMPESYRNLLSIGIKEDHTMGYSTELGFRAGIAAPFVFYDLEKEEETELILYPFCMMDITPMHYYRLNIPDSIALIKEQINVVRECGGLYISLWHNESLSDAQQWTGWRELYEFILEDASASGEA